MLFYQFYLFVYVKYVSIYLLDIFCLFYFISFDLIRSHPASVDLSDYINRFAHICLYLHSMPPEADGVCCLRRGCGPHQHQDLLHSKSKLLSSVLDRILRGHPWVWFRGIILVHLKSWKGQTGRVVS